MGDKNEKIRGVNIVRLLSFGAGFHTLKISRQEGVKRWGAASRGSHGIRQIAKGKAVGLKAG